MTDLVDEEDVSGLPPPPAAPQRRAVTVADSCEIRREKVDSRPFPAEFLKQRRGHGTVTGQVGLYLAGIGAGLVGLHALGVATPACPLRSATGIPCPFCGMTHVAHDTLTGHFGVVATHDPAGLVLVGLLGVVVVLQLVAMLRRTEGPAVLQSRVTIGVIVAVLAAHWITTIITGGMLTT